MTEWNETDKDWNDPDAGRIALLCPECGEEVWDLPFASKLAKCWNAEGHSDGGTLAFDTMED